MVCSCLKNLVLFIVKMLLKWYLYYTGNLSEKIISNRFEMVQDGQERKMETAGYKVETKHPLQKLFFQDLIRQEGKGNGFKKLLFLLCVCSHFNVGSF